MDETRTFTTLQRPVTDRDTFQDACISLLRPLVPFFSSGNTRVRLGASGTRYDESGAQLEGFARPLWGLAALLAGGGAFEESWRWVEGLRNGTNPDHPEFWGWSRDVDQRMVEMCPIGFALAVAGDPFWTHLSAQDRENLSRWLRCINARQMPNTNWLWFRVFANLGLAKNGAVHDPERMEQDLQQLDTFYRGDGWSNDGPTGYTQMDSYSGSFAIQYLQLLYAKINGDRDPRRAELFRERARTFALDAVHYYDEIGRHITFGRSLTYRFAMAGFWSAVAFADLKLPSPLSWGVVKGLLLRNCRWWTEQKDILTPQGTLSIGYCYSNQFMSENYNSPGSPYWFMLSFAALACPEEHPFWAAKEEPYPASSLPMIKSLSQPKHILVRKGDHKLLLSSGQMCHYPVRAGAAKYGKFAYSSAFGYSVPTGEYFLEAVGVDNTIGLSDDFATSTFGETWRVRRVAIDARIELFDQTPVLVSHWEPWPDVRITSWLVPPANDTPNWHIRLHHIQSERNLRAVEGAWAIHGYRSTDGRELGTLDTGSTEGRAEGVAEALAVSISSGAVGIVDLLDKQREGKVIDADANSNLIYNRTVLPVLSTDVAQGTERWFGTTVFALPASATNWQQRWRDGWNLRPTMPSWATELIQGKASTEQPREQDSL